MKKNVKLNKKEKSVALDARVVFFFINAIVSKQIIRKPDFKKEPIELMHYKERVLKFPPKADIRVKINVTPDSFVVGSFFQDNNELQWKAISKNSLLFNGMVYDFKLPTQMIRVFLPYNENSILEVKEIKGTHFTAVVPGPNLITLNYD